VLKSRHSDWRFDGDLILLFGNAAFLLHPQKYEISTVLRAFRVAHRGICIRAFDHAR
jgi:hypothetical protein